MIDKLLEFFLLVGAFGEVEEGTGKGGGSRLTTWVSDVVSISLRLRTSPR